MRIRKTDKQASRIIAERGIDKNKKFAAHLGGALAAAAAAFVLTTGCTPIVPPLPGAVVSEEGSFTDGGETSLIIPEMTDGAEQKSESTTSEATTDNLVTTFAASTGKKAADPTRSAARKTQPAAAQETSVPAETTVNSAENSGGGVSDGDVQEFSDFRARVLSIVNRERAAQGAKPLTENIEVTKIARMKSQDMADYGYFDHTSPTYGTPFQMLRQFGISYNAAGENIAKGQKTPEEVMDDWMNSQGHRENILNANFTQIGIGIVQKGGTFYWTQMFVG